jgi:hypothetical protein
VAFVDNDNNGAFSATTDPVFNITINRVYTGYVRLRKRSQIIRDGAVAPGADGILDENPKNVRPGDVIRYVVEYVNFSLPNAGSGNVVLDASNLVITEDAANPGNTWGANTVHFNSAVVVDGAPQNTFASQGTILYNGAPGPDPATGSAVNRYDNNVGTVPPLPGANATTFQGLFRFHRRVN